MLGTDRIGLAGGLGVENRVVEALGRGGTRLAFVDPATGETQILAVLSNATVAHRGENDLILLA